MEKKTKKLQLSRESVRLLNDSSLSRVAGAGEPTERSYCAANPCGTHMVHDSCVQHVRIEMESLSVLYEADELETTPLTQLCSPMQTCMYCTDTQNFVSCR